MKFDRSRRRLAISIGAIAVTSLVLSGCSAPAEDEGGPVTLDVWGWNPDEKSAPSYFDAFEEENPDITVNYRFIQASDFVNTVRLAATTADGPDVFGLQVGVFPEQFAPLTVDVAPYLEDALGAEWQEQLTGADQYDVDGKQVAAPWYTSAAGFMWVNMAVADELGLAVPTTLDELIAFNAAATAAGKQGLVQGGKDGFANLDLFQIVANQVAPGSFNAALDGDESFDGDEMIESLEIWQQLFTDGALQEGALGFTAYPDANDARITGEAAMIPFGSWQFRDATNTRTAEYAETYGDPAIADTVFMPVDFPAVTGDATVGSLFGGPDVGWSVSAQSDAKDAAGRLVAWLTTSDSAVELLGTALRPPALKGSTIDLSDVKTPEQAAAIESLVERSEDLVGPREVADPDVKSTLIEVLSSVAAGSTKPADGAAQVQAAIDAAS
jgi:raffinose/stachyose/melibiose transport system substrate-binding protein